MIHFLYVHKWMLLVYVVYLGSLRFFFHYYYHYYYSSCTLKRLLLQRANNLYICKLWPYVLQVWKYILPDFYIILCAHYCIKDSRVDNGPLVVIAASSFTRCYCYIHNILTKCNYIYVCFSNLSAFFFSDFLVTNIFFFY